MDKYNISVLEKSLKLAVLAIVTALSAHAQRSASISGQLLNAAGQPVAGANVSIQEDTLQTQALYQSISDQRGLFRFDRLDTGTYYLVVTHMAYGTRRETVRLTGDPDARLTIRLPEKMHELTDVNVVGKTETRRAAEQSVKAVVVNTREVSLQPVSLNELINRAPGVRIRQTGGLGSTTELSVNGFQGRSIRYFRDGVPIDYLRDGYHLATVPVNMLERVEIYKGVLPVALGADALGGAVNLVTRSSRDPYLDISYEIASFNSHRLALNGYVTDNDKKWFAGIQSFYNHSDNDYTALVKVTDPVTKNQKNERVRLFHNGFTSHYYEVFAGVTNRSWADELKLSAAAFRLTREQQHPALMTDPYGAVEGGQRSVVPSLSYWKSWLDDRLSIRHFMVYNTLTLTRTDTLRGQYDWYGNFTSTPWKTGESRQPALSAVDFGNFIARTFLSHRLTSAHTLEINHVYVSSVRTGSDPYGTRFDGTDIDVLSHPATYRKQVVTAGLESGSADRRWIHNLIVKHYRFGSKGTEAWAARAVGPEEEVQQTGTYWGVAEAVRLQVTPDAFARVSAEWASRLPEQDELFGDAMWTVPNFSLRPERSLNLNLGYRVDRPGKFVLEAGGFFRRTTGMILLVPTQAPYAQYQNMENVRGYGLEADGRVHFTGKLAFNANFTWQSVRLFGLETGQDRCKNGARLRNTPYFFANTGISGTFPKVFTPGDRLFSYVNLNVVREYYLETIPRSVESTALLGLAGRAKIQSDLIIPTQYLLSAGATYQPGNRLYSVGLEVKNLLNTDLYDYFRVQKAGRSIHLKIGLLLHKKKQAADVIPG